MCKKIVQGFGVMVLAGATALAGSFTSDFSDPNQLGFTLTSNGGYRADGVTPFTAIVEDGHLVLSYNELGSDGMGGNMQEIGSFIIDELDSYQPIESFTVRFKMQIGPGSGNPADGVAFCFGPDVNSSSNFGESGTGSGVIVSFDTYDNGEGAPYVAVRYNNAVIASQPFAKADMVTSKFEDVFIQLTRSGTLNVGYKGAILFTNLVLPEFAPNYGQFGWGARSGGESALHMIDDLSVTTVVAGDLVAPSVTANPQGQTIPEGGDVTFSVGFDGSAPMTFQWYRNNSPITGATASTLTLTAVSYADNQAKYKCEVNNTVGSATSQEATLTVIQDLTAPTLVSVKGTTDFLGVMVTFSEPVADASGGNKANYTIAGLTVDSATVNGATVRLVTSRQAEGTQYTVVVNNVKDRALAGNTIAANSQASFRTFAVMLGTLLHKKYDNINDNLGANPQNLFDDPRFPDLPDRADLINRWEYPSNGLGRVAADPTRNYFDTIEGYFIPPADGNYVFFIAGADRFWLYLSTDDNPANMYMIAAEPGGWTDPRFWLTTHDTDPARHRSDYSQYNEWPMGGTITLEKGKRYYMLEVHHDPSWCGGDFFGATYAKEGEVDPADGSAPRLTGSVVGCLLDPTGSSVTINQQPADVTIEAGRSAVFTVGATATSSYGPVLMYQWQRQAPGAGTWVNIEGANAASYTTPALALADNGAKFRAMCMAPGINEPSAAATLTVFADVVRPTLVVANGSPDFLTATVTFSEPVDETTGGNKANYTIAGLTVDSATVLGEKVVLATSKQAEATTYTIVVNNVKDRSLAGNTIVANSQVELKTFVFESGAVVHKKYNDIDNGVGANPANLFTDPRYPNEPDRIDIMATWEYPAAGAGRDDVADPVRQYFDTLEGFFIPPENGNYVFLTAGADRWWLYLSTDEDPANLTMIAGEPGGWSDPRGWLQAYGGTLTERRSDMSTLNTWSTAPTITLEKGKRYYMLELHHDPSWCGADDFSATFKLETDDDPANGTVPTLAGSAVGYYVDPTGSSVVIDEQPADATAVLNRDATFTVVATGVSTYGSGISYQWQRMAPGGSTWADLAGAIGATYTTPLLTLADSGAKYRVVCKVPGVSQTSTAATLTVVPDTFAPKVAGAGAIASQTGTTFDVSVTFDEDVDETTAATQSNYTLSAGTITGIKFYAGSPGVVLTVSGLTPGSSYTVTVKNVKDLAGNAITSETKSLKVSAMKWGVVGANELGLGNGVLAVGDNGFDVYSDGISEWGTYDEATFVYEQVTGDFDKVVRVEYQDASSQWARAGLIARDVTNFGVNRAAQTNGAAGRYQKAHVSPVQTAMGTAGNNSWEGNRRLVTGGTTDGAGGGGQPMYPDAWCRLQRVGQTFNIYRSNDGENWLLYGTTVFNPAMPDTLFVGPEYAPENGNVDVGLRSVWLAQFRDYGDYGVAPAEFTSITANADGSITVTWEGGGTLEAALSVLGPWQAVTGATSPYTFTPQAPMMFGRIVK